MMRNLIFKIVSYALRKKKLETAIKILNEVALNFGRLLRIVALQKGKGQIRLQIFE